MKLVGRGKFTRQANAKLSRKLEFDVGGSNTPAKSPQGPGPGAPIQTDTDRIQVYREALRNKYALSELEKVMLEALEAASMEYSWPMARYWCPIRSRTARSTSTTSPAPPGCAASSDWKRGRNDPWRGPGTCEL